MRSPVLRLPLVLPLALALAACGTSTQAARTAAARAATFELPAPTGPHRAIGTTELHLADPARADPWVPGRARELMVSVFYPAARRSGPPAPYLRPGVAKVLSQVDALGVFKAGTVDWAAARTHAAESVPADLRGGARPVVLYSPGFGVPRALGTTLAEELATRGYVVVTVDHTYETAPVEFPGGRVENQRLPGPGPERLKTALDTRVKDTRLVLDRLAALRDGRNPDAEGRALPSGLGRALDLSRVGMAGHSARRHRGRRGHARRPAAGRGHRHGRHHAVREGRLRGGRPHRARPPVHADGRRHRRVAPDAPDHPVLGGRSGGTRPAGSATSTCRPRATTPTPTSRPSCPRWTRPSTSPPRTAPTSSGRSIRSG
ncbi:alpha/beta hydrolase [Actinomadura madurae]|uniref:alpha/beta hydrolase n=1 Tax=Actinomadura madurae TaxID=1993 RepID=UPI0020D204FC|nr:hypothetical protein [Actinomadura madurae]MCP9977992.1 hypothetical protein [Actinomadura madurae]